MKRKVKLFSAIASLCLAVALMAFGVYAATNVSWTVSSSVSFESQLHVKLEGSVSGGSLEAEQKFNTNGREIMPDEENPQDATWEINEVAFGATAEKQTITYTFKITNLGKDSATVTVDDTELKTKLFGDTNLKVVLALKGTAKPNGVETTYDDDEPSAYTKTDNTGNTDTLTLLKALNAKLATGEYITVEIKVSVVDSSKSLDETNDSLNIKFVVE